MFSSLIFKTIGAWIRYAGIVSAPALVNGKRRMGIIARSIIHSNVPSM